MILAGTAKNYRIQTFILYGPHCYFGSSICSLQRHRDFLDESAKEHTAKAAQRYDEMVLENESLQTQYEELKISAMKMYRQRNDQDDYGMRGGGAGGRMY